MYKFSHSPFYFIWNNSQVLCLVNKNVGHVHIFKTEGFIEKVYICACVYVCVQFFPKTRGQMKPKFMWNHNRIGEES